MSNLYTSDSNMFVDDITKQISTACFGHGEIDYHPLVHTTLP